MKGIGIALISLLAGVSLMVEPAPALAQTNGTILGTDAKRPNPERDNLRRQAQENLERGNTLLTEGNFDAAIEALQRATELYPPIDAYHVLGEALEAKGRLAEAVHAYSRAVYKQPGQKWLSSRGQDGDVLLKYALLLAKVGRYEEAVQVYQQAVNHGKLSQPLLAVRFSPRALNKRLFNAAALTGIGTFYAERGYEDKAIPAYEQAIRTKPDYALAYLQMGYALRSKRQLAQARAAWLKAIRLGEGEVAKKAKEALSQ